MCEQCPCWPTPAEAQALIDKGYKDRLMLDRRCRRSGDLFVLSPAISGREGGVAPLRNPIGRCTFLTNSGKCELHKKGLKPIEGRLASCGAKAENGEKLRRAVAQTWNTKEGRQIVKTWKIKTDYFVNLPYLNYESNTLKGQSFKDFLKLLK